MKIMSRVISGAVALLLCAGLIGGMMMTSFADGEEGEEAAGPVYASTDYANHEDQFIAFMDGEGDKQTVTFPLPEGYKEGDTVRVKYIVNGALIGEKYSGKAFVMPFANSELKIDGAFLAEIGGKRIDIQIEKRLPIRLEYKCPKCELTDEVDKDGNPTGNKYKPHTGALDKYDLVEGDQYLCPKCKSTFTLSEAGEPEHLEVVDGGISIIENDKHPVVGGYVYELKIYSDGKAISEFSSDKGGSEASIKLGGEAFTAAKNENSKAVFNVYAYLGQERTYENMGATVDQANGVATFKIKDRGWFFVAADDPANAIYTPWQIFMKWLPIIIVGVVVIAAAVVVLIVVLKKKNAPAAE